jgi:hypothetical protein
MTMSNTHSWVIMCTAVCVGVGAAHAELIQPVSQDRSILSDGTFEDFNGVQTDTDNLIAEDFGHFQDFASVYIEPDTFTGLASSGGSHNSRIEDTQIVGQGSAFTNTEAYEFDVYSSSSAQNTCEFVFTLRQRSTVSLEWLLAAYDSGYTELDLLSVDRGELIFSPDEPFNEEYFGTENLDLPRGTYRVRARASASAYSEAFFSDYGFGEYSFTLDAAIACPGDNTEDGQVNVDDFFSLLQHWGSCPGGDDPCLADCAPGTGDGIIGVDDFFATLQNWGDCD